MKVGLILVKSQLSIFLVLVEKLLGQAKSSGLWLRSRQFKKYINIRNNLFNPFSCHGGI